MGHRLRARADAILVGSGTVRDDDPDLTVRIPGLEHRSPMRVVLDSKLSAVTLRTRLSQTARAVPVLVFTGRQAPAGKIAALEAAGVKVSAIGSVDGKLDLAQALRWLAERGVTRLMVEGGPSLWPEFIRRGFVDEAIVFAAGGPGNAQWASSVPSLALFARSPAPDLTLVERGTIGNDTFFRFETREP